MKEYKWYYENRFFGIGWLKYSSSVGYYIIRDGIIFDFFKLTFWLKK